MTDKKKSLIEILKPLIFKIADLQLKMSSQIERQKNNKEVECMLPDISKPIPLNEYCVGAYFTKEENASYFAVFNRTTKLFEYQAKIFTSSENDFDMFCDMISKYFDATILIEK